MAQLFEAGGEFVLVVGDGVEVVGDGVKVGGDEGEPDPGQTPGSLASKQQSPWLSQPCGHMRNNVRLRINVSIDALAINRNQGSRGEEKGRNAAAYPSALHVTLAGLAL